MIACIVAFCLNGTARLGAGRKDSIMYQTGATLLGPHLYDYREQRQLQVANWAPYLRAPFYAVLLKPLLYFDFTKAWLAVRTICLVLLLLMLPRALGLRSRWYFIGLALPFVSLPINFAWGQDGVINLIVLAGALWLRRSGRRFAAGALLAFTLQKPTLFVLLPVALVLCAEWKMVKGYAVAAALLIATSLAIVGAQGIRDYPHLVSTAVIDLHQMPTCRGIADSLGWQALWPVTALAAIALFAWSAKRSPKFESVYCLAIIGSLFLSPNSYSYDLAIVFLPVLYFLNFGQLLQKIGAAIYCFPPVHLMFTLGRPWSAANGLALGAFLALAAWGQLRSQKREAPRDRAYRSAAGPNLRS